MTTLGKLARLHEHGLPDRVRWGAVADTVLQCLEQPPYPPERFWAIDPRGPLRGAWVGDEHSVTVPFRELGKLYQAVFLHSHPPGMPPTVHDAYHAVIAASPLLVVVEGETAHLVMVWHDRSPGLVGTLLWEAPDLRAGLRRARGSWRRVPLHEVGEAIRELEERWQQFLLALEE
ncbi:hypothetical protein OO015_00475 [Thermomicrobium sp. 4228-Ro]|uniref:hypothetical protein n=1 Tax=Thermomicrobium sp. 4228-Ro TaxID=2993937 RepID=UPI0022495237|nr:hypothetical protein [Thermomicrobium sp. 4228-Ro]MCX2725982.1 hypothetical protein [Thermomicrobium sp. 4228-Ro]